MSEVKDEEIESLLKNIIKAQDSLIKAYTEYATHLTKILVSKGLNPLTIIK